MKYAQIVLKVTERCNLNCKYCYFFNCENQAYKNHHSVLSRKIIGDVAKFINEAISDLDLSKVLVSIHGGEPLMMSKSRFRFMMEELTNIEHKSKLIFSVQTNGTMIDDEWVSIFKEYNISVGLSLDGPKIVNDENRIQKSGKGTYDKIIKGMNLLKNENSVHLSVFSVANLEHPASIVYNHITQDLNIDDYFVLIEDLNHETITQEILDKDYHYLKEQLDCWVSCKKSQQFHLLRKFLTDLVWIVKKVYSTAKEILS